MQFNINEHRDFFIAADTDSAIFTMELLLQKDLGPDYKNTFKDEDILIKCKEYIAKYSDKLNKTYLSKLAKNKFNIDKHMFNWKTENILKTALWSGKRRYAQYIIEKEGVRVEEMDFKGLELFKSNMNKMFKTFGEQIIKDILHDRPKKEIDKDIVNFYNSLKTTDPKQLSKPMGVKKISEYILQRPQEGEIFTTFKDGARENTRAAVIYNDLLRHYGLDKKHESIIDGDKIFIVNLKNNKFKINVIGIPNAKVPEEISSFINEFIDIEHIFESLLLNKLTGLYEDIGWEFPILNKYVSKFFQFS